MSFTEKLQQIDLLQQTIINHGLLAEPVLKKINYKFRLEWNYTSNSMEGNSLTRQETRSIMVGNITVEGKPVKDVLEMKGHDEVVNAILKMGKGELNISEKRIKDIHKAIIHEEDPQKQQQIGIWKKNPNHLFNYKNERFDFVDPADVPDRMHQLINWLNAQIEKVKREDKKALHPVEIAMQFHLDYISIHPFFDGNGRTARIFTNIILIAFGYPPIYIKEIEKQVYYQYLADIQGYGGNPDLFFDFMAGTVLRSQQLVLDAIEGKEIEEPDDLDKKILLLEKELEVIDPDEEVKIHFSREVFIQIADSWLTDLLNRAIPVVQKFNKLFSGTNHHIHLTTGMGNISFIDQPSSEIIKNLKNSITQYAQHFSEYNMEFIFRTSYGTFKKGGLKTFGCSYGFKIKFRTTKYEVFTDIFSEGDGTKDILLYERLLHQPLTQVEISNISMQLGDTIFQHIDFYTKKIGLRK